MIEAKTYRQAGHSRADPGKYRPDEEVAEWLAKDPIPMYHARLLAEGATEAQLAEIDREVAAMVDLATQEAKDGAIPSADLVFKDVWADGGSAWRN